MFLSRIYLSREFIFDAKVKYKPSSAPLQIFINNYHTLHEYIPDDEIIPFILFSPLYI